MIRQITEFTARGMVRSGCSASAAAMPMVSMPPKENTSTGSASSVPVSPCGNQPPCVHRLAKPIGRPPLPQPNRIMPSPPRIISTTVSTLISANQNSSSPYTFTAIRLSAPISSTLANAHVH